MALNAKTPLQEKNKPELNMLCNHIAEDGLYWQQRFSDQQGIQIATRDNWQSHHTFGLLPDSTPGIAA